MAVQIEEYDQWTVNYLRGVGVEGALLERVERLAKEAAVLRAEAAAWKQAALDASKAGA